LGDMEVPPEILELADHSRLAVIATRADGVVIYWNRAATDLYLWSSKEAVGRNILSLTPCLESKGQAQQVMSRLRAGESWHGKIELRRRDGLPFVAYVANRSLTEPAGAILGVSGDARDSNSVLAEADRLAPR
jgi:PAS domain S-box-containing protein